MFSFKVVHQRVKPYLSREDKQEGRGKQNGSFFHAKFVLLLFLSCVFVHCLIDIICQKYIVSFWGGQGICPPCDKEDRPLLISSLQKDRVEFIFNRCDNNNHQGNNTSIRTIKKYNYNGVINPKHTGDPGPHERQNMKSTFQCFGKQNGTIGGLELRTLPV